LLFHIRSLLTTQLWVKLALPLLASCFVIIFTARARARLIRRSQPWALDMKNKYKIE
jgi:hypothetical protein